MGAIPYEGGVTFRVWAPNAERVFVSGDFNNWSKRAHPLAPQRNGHWSTNVPKAKAGDGYKFVILNGQQELVRMDPYAKETICSTCSCLVHDPAFDWGTDAFERPELNKMVIYEMHIGTFNFKGGHKPGNFNTAIEKLAHLKELGVNAIEVMPAMEFEGSFSWGYNPALMFAIESDYGGPRAFKEFVKAAHSDGIAVIFDVVYNHLGPGDLDLWQFDGWQENDKGGIYFYNDWRAQTPWGDTRPDYGREQVRQYIRDNAFMWLQEFRVDGLRWDATAFVRNVQGNNDDPEHDIAEGWSLMQWVNDQIKAKLPGRVTIAEDIRDNSSITGKTGEGGAGFDAQWDSIFVHNIREAIAAPEDRFVNMEAIGDAILHRCGDDVFQRVIYTESHDEVANGKSRVPEEVSSGNAATWIAKKLSTLGAALVFTSPGVPMIFQGQEFLEDDWFHDKDPIDWSKKERFAGIVRLYKDLIGVRRNIRGNTAGLCGRQTNLHRLDIEGKVIAFHRYERDEPADSVIVVVNMKNEPRRGCRIGFPRNGLWRLRFNSDSRLYDGDFGDFPTADVIAKDGEVDGMPSSGEVDVGPYSVVVFSEDKQKQ
ncbi:MAG: alpha amylase C-terminal domain-containing protein [Phycisphaerales bacterium]|nr:MAG: alpha amylase C-terminal domain-containing protein [Phycisphaerales bacterium]